MHFNESRRQFGCAGFCDFYGVYQLIGLALLDAVRHGFLGTARQRREINDQGSVAVQDVLYGSCTVLSRVQFDDGIPVRYPAVFRYAILRTGSTAREYQRKGCVQGAAVNACLCAGDDFE